MNRVEVAWLDSCHTLGTWTRIEDLKAEDLTPSRCFTCGYLVKQTDTEIVVALSQDKDNPGVTDAMVIPRACVQSITLLRDDTTELA